MDLNITNEVVSKLYNYSKSVKYYHWNYVDSDFYPIHPQMDEVYEQFLDQADTIAELGRQHDLFINPWSVPEMIESGMSDHTNAISTIVSLLEDIYTSVVALRQTCSDFDTGTQSALDQILYDTQVLTWKWNSTR